MVGCVLRKHIIGTSNGTQTLGGLGIQSLAIERITQDIVLNTSHLSATSLIGIHILNGSIIIIELKPRLRHNTLNLHSLFVGCLAQQRIALAYNSTIVASFEINLHNVEWHQIAIHSTIKQGIETIAGLIHSTISIGHIGFVISCVVGIIARTDYLTQILFGFGVIILLEGHIAHTQIVFILALWVEALVMHLRELLGSRIIILQHTIISTQCELHIVGAMRAVIFGKITLQTRLHILAFEFDIAQSEIVINLLNRNAVTNRREQPSSLTQFTPGLGPMAKIIQRHASLNLLLRAA